MNDPLATYLHDHLAGSKFAIELLDFLKNQNSGDPLGSFAEKMKSEIEDDRKVLEDLIARAQGDAPVVKEAASWLAEKMLRLKLSDGKLGAFEALEALGLGILGKLSLWRALEKVAGSEPRVRSLDYAHLASRAQVQQAQVEEFRLVAAVQALVADTRQ